MKRKLNSLIFVGMIIALTIVMQTDITAQQLLLNEIEIDPPSTVTDGCQFTEIRGTAGAVVPANTYFASVNSDGGNFGFANQAINFGGQVVGSNGTITLVNTASACTGRTFAPGTTLVTFSSPLSTGQGSETYLVVRSTGTLFSGLDLDTDDDGEFNAALGITVLDGFALLVNPKEEFVYGATAGAVNISNAVGSLDQPDAVTRFPNNTTPFSIAAFYYGELAASPDETTEYAAPFSPNFPAGGVLTPGAPNAPTTTVPGKARADFDGDGRTDLSVFRPSEATWYAQRSTAGFQAARFGQSSDILAPADYDGDGKADFAVFRENGFGDPNRGFFFILNSADGSVRSEQFGRVGDVPVAGDFDGDGKDDLAVYRNGASAGNQSFFYFRPSGTAGVNFNTQPWGISGDRAVGGNFDGDNKADFAVFRPSNNTWYVQRSTGGFTAQQWGLSSDILAPADYDGDGRDDLAVFRPSTNLWYILRSGNGAVDYVSFGQAGDVLVPGDYDGDGRADQAVFRGGNWFINRSTSGFAAFTFGNASDKPIPTEYLP